MTRRAAKVDGNHAAIRDALRKAGCRVYDCSGVGGDFPDLLVRFPRKGTYEGRWADQLQLMLIEVKDGSLPPSKRRLRPGQAQFQSDFAPFVVTVESVEQALALL